MEKIEIENGRERQGGYEQYQTDQAEKCSISRDGCRFPRCILNWRWHDDDMTMTYVRSSLLSLSFRFLSCSPIPFLFPFLSLPLLSSPLLFLSSFARCCIQQYNSERARYLWLWSSRLSHLWTGSRPGVQEGSVGRLAGRREAEERKNHAWQLRIPLAWGIVDHDRIKARKERMLKKGQGSLWACHSLVPCCLKENEGRRTLLHLVFIFLLDFSFLCFSSLFCWCVFFSSFGGQAIAWCQRWRIVCTRTVDHSRSRKGRHSHCTA